MAEIKTKKLSREEIANIEIGNTSVSTAQKYFLTLFFLLLIGIYPCFQFYYHQPFREWRKMETAQKSIKAYETALEDTSLLRAFLLTPAQRFLTGVFHLGNEKVIIGNDGWLFYSGDYEYLINPGFLCQEKLHKRILSGVQPDPAKAILDFKAQLDKRGIRLILMPVPVKPMIYPDKLGGGNTFLQNPSWQEFKRRMEDAGVTVVDLAPGFAEMRKQGVEPYLKTDTHWTPEGMYFASGLLAEAINGAKTKNKPSETAAVQNLGDIAAMLKLPDCERYFSAEKIQNPQFNMKTDRSSDILLLGDSFCNIFSLETMRWGADSGLPEALGYQLGRTVDAICRNDAGAFATRQLLSSELKRGRDRLAGKKIVVWEFAIRELVNGDWKMLEMKLGNVPESRFLTVTVPRDVTATILAMTEVPRPHSAPYGDHVMSLHIGDIDGGSDEALVYIVSMKNNVWTQAPKLRIGDTVKITLSPWSDQEKHFGTWNRSEFEDENLLIQEPVFGELKR
ncbi:MAG: hypothetical protein MJ033_06040 [Victivallaceae bacterium]|nr:hypothetical protein [Victivallaceae bacterium]